MEGVAGVGCTISAVLGYYLYQAAGFSLTFFICGVAFLPALFLLLCLKHPNEVDVEDVDEEDEAKNLLPGEALTEQKAPEANEPKKLKYSQLICKQRILMAAISGAVMGLVYDSL